MITAARVTDHVGLYCLQYEKVLLLWLLAGCSFRELLCMLCIPAEPFPVWNTPFFTYDFMLVQFFFFLFRCLHHILANFYICFLCS